VCRPALRWPGGFLLLNEVTGMKGAKHSGAAFMRLAPLLFPASG